MNEDQIVNRIECIEPLPTGGSGVLKKRDVLCRETEKVSDIDNKFLLFALEVTGRQGANSEKTTRLFLSRNTNEHECGKFLGFHPGPGGRFLGLRRQNEGLLLEKQLP